MRALRLVAINVGVFIAVLIVAEGSASLLIAGRRAAERWWPQASVNDAYLALPMYQRNPDARAYWNEFERSSANTYVDYVGWRRRDFHGRFITVTDGYRATPGAGNSGPLLGAFGGSAMWGTGVADRDTIPAALARATGGRWQVRNYGEAGYNVMQDFLEFYGAVRDRRAPAVAVFYDGINDADASCVNPGRNGATLEFARMKEKVEYRLGSDLRLADLATVVADAVGLRRPPEHYRCEDDAQARDASAAMVRTWRTIQDLGDRRGVRTYFFLQPVAYVGNPNVSYLKLDETLRPSFQHFYAHVDEQARAQGLAHYRDLSGILSIPDAQFYIDFAHVTPEANRRIASAIAAELHDDGE